MIDRQKKQTRKDTGQDTKGRREVGGRDRRGEGVLSIHRAAMSATAS